MSATNTEVDRMIDAAFAKFGVNGRASQRSETDRMIDAAFAKFGVQEPYVAGGPGGIPGAKDGLPADPNASLAFGYPGEAPASPHGPDTIRAIMAFKQNVKAQGGNIDGKSDAEVLSLMQKFGPTPGATASDYQPQTTALDEFGRGLRRGAAYGLPLAIPGVEALRESEQVQRAPEGLAGFAGQTLGGFTGLINPEQAPANFAAIALTGGVGRLAAGPLEMVGKKVAESLGKEAGARVVNALRETVENAGQAGGMAALQEVGNITPDEWVSDPVGALGRVGKAAAIGAGAGGGLGAAFGAARKGTVPVPRETLPERVFDRMLTADEAEVRREQARGAVEGQSAMLDAASAYRAAPRVGELDPQIIAAAREAERLAMDQARASARSIDESTPAPVREPTPVQEIPSEVPEAQGQGRQEELLAGQPAPDAKAPAVDSLSYADLRKRAAALGVLEGGAKTKPALLARVRAAEQSRQTLSDSQGTPRGNREQMSDDAGTILDRATTGPLNSNAGTDTAQAAGANPAQTQQVQTRTSQTDASPNPTRQPWEMTKADVDALTYDEFLEADRKMGKVYGDLYWRLKNENVDPADVELHKRIIAATDLFHDRSEAFDAERKARQEVASKKISNGEPWSVTRAAFVSHHKTGSISESAYEKYATREGVSFLGKPEKYPEVVGGRDGIEYRTGNAKDTIVAFDKEGPIGWVSNEFGVPGVFVISDYQRRGVGTELLDLWMSAKPPNQKIGQMTGSGQSMAGAYHKRLVTRALSEGRPVPPAVLADYPDMAMSGGGEATAQPTTSRTAAPEQTTDATAIDLDAARTRVQRLATQIETAPRTARPETTAGQYEELKSHLRDLADANALTNADLRSVRGVMTRNAIRDAIARPVYGTSLNPSLEPRFSREELLAVASTVTPRDAAQISTYKALVRAGRSKAEAQNAAMQQLIDEAKNQPQAPAPDRVLKDYPDLATRAKPPTPAEAGTTPKPPRDGWTLELEGSGRRYWRSPDGKEIAREDGSMLRFESKSHVWDNGGKERMAKAIGASTESPAKAIQDVPTTRPPSTVAELKESLVRVQKSQGKRYALKMQSEWMKNRESWGVSPYDDLEEYRSAGYVTRSNDGSKYTLLVVSGTDTPKWRIASKIDVTDQFVKAPDAAPLPTEAARGTTPAGTGAGQVEAPKASGKPTAHSWEMTAKDMVPVPGGVWELPDVKRWVGELRDSGGNYIGDIWKHEAGWYHVVRPINSGKNSPTADAYLPGTYGPNDFVRTHTEQVSASRSIKVFRFRRPEERTINTDNPGTAPGTAPKAGSLETPAKEAPEPRPRTSDTGEPVASTPTHNESRPTSGQRPPAIDKEPAPSEVRSPDSERVRESPSELDASSQDFTARRVIDRPEPGEPEGPVTAAKNEMTSAMREALGLDAFDSPERRTWQAQLDNAVAKKIHERALDISSSVVARPRALSAEEQAGMVYRLMELDNQKRALKEKIAGTTDEGSLLSLHATDDRATSEIDVITTALNKGGSDIGRALNIRKMLLADDFSIIGIRNKVKKYELQSGKKIDPEQMKELEALAERFESMTKRMEKAAQDSIDSAAESTLKRHAASKRGIPKEAREKIIVDLAANVRQLIESGCR